LESDRKREREEVIHMPTSVPARYTVQIGPTTTPETAGEIGAWAEHIGMSMSEAARECLEDGLKTKRKEWAKAHGSLPAALLARHVEYQRARGERQVRTRLSYRDRRAAEGDPLPSRRRRGDIGTEVDVAQSA
jgi:hypothetical protein